MTRCREWQDRKRVIMGQTIVEKIAQAHLAEGPKRPLRTGDFVSIRPHRVMTHDNTSAVMKKFQAIGAKKIHDPQQLVFALDHDIQNKEESNLQEVPGHRSVRQVSRRGFLSCGFGHWAPDHGGARIRGARIVRRRVRFALQHVRSAGRNGDADRAHRCGGGHGRQENSGGRFRDPSRLCWKARCRRARPEKTSSSPCAGSTTTMRC